MTAADSLLHLPLQLALPYLLVLATPGPNLLLVLRASLEPTPRPALATAAGIGAGAGLAAGAAVLGALTLPLLAGVEPAARVALAAILARTGWRTLRAARRPAARAARAAAPSAGGHFRIALATAVTNPMTVAFFAGFFLGRLAPGDISAALVACLSAAALACGWFLLLSHLLRRPPMRSAYAEAGGSVNLVLGLALLACAAITVLPLVVPES